ncbi:MAG TPA: hydrogenase maturation protease [Coriobacteriia bacterium]|nr:hydrogenase maturation protease [Coriobacteriia bacterium]
MRRVSVIGIGNTMMGDDGVGVRVAEGLAERLDSANVVSGEMAGMSLMPHVLSSDAVVFVDALAVDDEPGTIYRFDPDEAGITGLRSTTTHGMGIPYLITNSRLQGHWPDFVVYAIHIGDIMCGPDVLSPAVAEVLPKVTALVAEEVERLQAGR